MKLPFFFFFIFFQLQISYATEFKGKFEQGSFILGKTDPGSKVFIDKRKIRVSKQGFFAFGLDRDRKNDVTIRIHKDNKITTIYKKVLKREYKIQRIDGLPPKQVTPPPEVYERIKKDNKLIGDARSEVAKVVWPSRGETTQMSVIVLIMILILALVFWGLDTLLSFLSSFILG